MPVMEFLFTKFSKDKFLHWYFSRRLLKEYLWNRTYFSITAPHILKRDKTFGNGMRNLFSKQFKCPRILSISKHASIGDFPSKLSTANAIAKGLQLYPQFAFGQEKI